MKKLGLALSGGGFRASLYHLGLVRFLRDAGILPQVSHITAVSGGSIFAAHLVNHWDRYNGSPKEFDAAAAEFLAFVRLDVRNRIARRFPLAMPLRWARRLVGRSSRQLTRTGLLEYHYEKFLYGDMSLFELPEKPELHLLATNVSEGCLCSFTRNGLLMLRRQPGDTVRIDRVHVGLATVAMAVAASSAFPGFFPPLELTGADVGARVGEFGRQAYTDGGVFDNLGVRMFRCLQRPLLVDSPLTRDDFLDLPAAIEALRQASQSRAESPLGRLGQLLAAAGRRSGLLRLPDVLGANGPGVSPDPGAAPPGTLAPLAPTWQGAPDDHEAFLLSGLWDVMRHYQFQGDPFFADLKLAGADADSMFRASRLNGRGLDAGDQLWLNRQVLEAAFRGATGRACFRRLDSGLDGVLVSDVGKPFEVQSNRRAGGVIRTALRATDILMDRVWQLEKETFRDTLGFVFAPITEVVEPCQDATAMHPEIQRQTVNIRTDLDRFSPLEISSLARHGYCVGRKVCRARPELFGADLPDDAPWDPVPPSRGAGPSVPVGMGRDGSGREPAAETVEARTLQASAVRRIWSTLLDYRDWVSYIHVPIIVPLLILSPYFAVKSYQRSHRLNYLIASLSQGNRDLEQMSRLLEYGPQEPWPGEDAEEVSKFDPAEFSGFEVLQDSWISDLRRWQPTPPGKHGPGSRVHHIRRLKVAKRSEGADANQFRWQLLASDPKAAIRFPPQRLQSRLRRCFDLEHPVSGEKPCHWEATFDFQSVPAGDLVDLVVEYQSDGHFLHHSGHEAAVDLNILANTAELTAWILMPEGKEYRNFHVIRRETAKSGKVENVRVVTEYLSDDFTILAFKLMSLKAGYTYEVHWLDQ